VELPDGRFTATQAQGRVTYTLTPRVHRRAGATPSAGLLGTNLRWR
jgi:hypothetical protein